jgi:hypothetical protein
MLPKEEKTKKKKIDGEQVGLFDKEDAQAKRRKKRQTVYFVLFFTVGLTLLMSLYHGVKNFNPQSLKFSTPKLENISQIKPIITKQELIDITKNDSATWSIKLINSSQDPVFEKNSQNFSDSEISSIVKKIADQDSSSSIIYAKSLPEGIKIKESIFPSDNNLSYFAEISVPNQQFFILIKITNSKDLTQSISLLPQLIDQLYWYRLQK